jgi:hypothetical protein
MIEDIITFQQTAMTRNNTSNITTTTTITIASTLAVFVIPNV